MYKVIQKLLSSLNSKPKFNAAKVKEYISKFSDEKIEHEIIPLLKQLEPAEKAEIIEALEESGFVDKQISVLLANGTVEKKLRAIEILVELEPDKGYLAMIAAIKDPREEIKWALTEALKSCKSPQLIIPKLLDSLKNPNQWLPARIAEICIYFGEVTIPYLAKELKKGSPDQKGIIIEILGELKSEQALKEIKKQAGSLILEQELYAKTIHAIGKVKSKVAVDLLLSSLENNDIKIKLAAIQALSNQNQKDLGFHLLPLLASSEALVRIKAGQALKALGWQVNSEQLKTISQKSFNLEELNLIIKQVRDMNLAG